MSTQKCATVSSICYSLLPQPRLQAFAWRFVRLNKDSLFLTVNRSAVRANCSVYWSERDGSVAEWLACWTQAQKGPGSNRSRDAVG